MYLLYILLFLFNVWFTVNYIFHGLYKLLQQDKLRAQDIRIYLRKLLKLFN